MTDAPGEGRPGLPLSPEFAADIDARLTRLRRPLGERALSDGTFCNLHLFRDAHAYRFEPGSLPCVSGRTYDGTPILLPLFDLAATPLEELQARQGPAAWFYPVPEAILGLLDASRIESRARREDADYLYAAAAFVDYAGPGLGPKRRAVARLLAQGSVEVRPLDAATRDEAVAVLDGWCADKGLGPGDADVAECRETLATLGRGGPLQGFIHTVDGVPAGFVLTEEINPGVLVARFAKGRAAFDGIFPYLFQDLVRRVVPAVHWLNFEQDLGNANFRRTKKSFRPAALLAKYRVRIRRG